MVAQTKTKTMAGSMRPRSTAAPMARAGLWEQGTFCQLSVATSNVRIVEHLCIATYVMAANMPWYKQNSISGTPVDPTLAAPRTSLRPMFVKSPMNGDVAVWEKAKE